MTTHTFSMKLCFTRQIIITHKNWNSSCQKHGMQHFLNVELARLFVVMNGLASMWTTSVKWASNKYNTMKVITCTGLETEESQSNPQHKKSGLNWWQLHHNPDWCNWKWHATPPVKIVYEESWNDSRFSEYHHCLWRENFSHYNKQWTLCNTRNKGQTNHKTTPSSNIKSHSNSYRH